MNVFVKADIMTLANMFVSHVIILVKNVLVVSQISVPTAMCLPKEWLLPLNTTPVHVIPVISNLEWQNVVLVTILV